MTNSLSIQVTGDPNYERLVAECYIDEEFVMLVSEDREPDVFDVEVMPDADGKPRRIPYDLMATLMERARKRLLDLDRTPGEG